MSKMSILGIMSILSNMNIIRRTSERLGTALP